MNMNNRSINKRRGQNKLFYVRKHARERLVQRYNIKISKNEYDLINDQICNCEKCVILDENAKGGITVLTFIKQNPVKLVFDKFDKKICTFIEFKDNELNILREHYSWFFDLYLEQ